MFQNDDLKKHLEESSVVRLQSAVIAEWNMNLANNIFQIGNYRYRKTSSTSPFKTLPNTFDSSDAGGYWVGATDADVVVDGGYSNTDEPVVLLPKKDKLKLLYSLEDCFNRFRPRSGINKASYFTKNFLHHSNSFMCDRPRYYMADKDDKFKYWTSFRTENGIEYGIANKVINGQNYIEDASPFVVYKNKLPANKIVVKMQTNVGTVDLGPFSNKTGSFSDPFYGTQNKTTPVTWKVQYLSGNNWVDAVSFNSSSTRRDGTAIIKSDGYVELTYGLKVPEKYRDSFIMAEEYTSESFLPEKALNGYAYLVKENETDIGVFHIWFDGGWKTFIPSYGWYLDEETVNRSSNFVTDLTNPVKYTDQSDGKEKYREFEYIRGIRIVVETMNKFDSTFDLIEISPRLTVDLSGKVTNFSITKSASDLGSSGMPVGQLLASTGTLDLFDYDEAFSPNNTGSIINGFTVNNLQVKFYEIIVNVDGYDYYVPIKTLYSEGAPSLSPSNRSVSLNLRDLYFYLESISAPQILITNASLSYAVSLLLDSIGFSNYTFKRVDGEVDPIIPFFHIAPDKSVAQVLNDLAVSTQTAMFFDEYNNFIMMSKEYMMPLLANRGTDFTLYGNDESYDAGVIENKLTRNKLSNIIDVASKENKVYNGGKITYESKYIQRTYGSLRQASMVDSEKTWIYKPVLLWEVSGSENTKSINGEVNNQSKFMLGAIPLNSTLSNVVPTVSNNVVINNTMDLGEGVYWITRYNGYFYSNGEVIKFDAVQYNISKFGNVWITSVQDYQNYFSKIPFNGKIYPTGLVRIYSEPNYEVVGNVTRLKNGPVAKHGRGQFGTEIVEHNAGISSYWSDNANVRGCNMKSKYLFSLDAATIAEAKANARGQDGPAGINNTLAQKTTRNSIIRNFLSAAYLTEADSNKLKSTQTGTIQSSALVMNGPSFTTSEKPVDFISYVYKPLTNKFKHFGTRMRIIGKVENNETRGQTPIGSLTYYVAQGTQPNQNINVGGGSGGLGVMLNPTNNNGYYFELIALTENNVESYSKGTESMHNLVFYKVVQDTNDTTGSALPIKLWGGLSKIVVDDGNFTGQYRMVGEETPTVYDIAVEYQDIGTTRRFFLYVNNRLVATVDDTNPLPIYNNMALFTRGSSRLMFENIYAICNNYSQNTVFALDTPVNAAYGDSEIDTNESFRKYAMSGIVQGTYLSGISSSEPPKYNIYFEEFGTIMREAAYFNVRYDKAYPALYAQLSPTFNRIKGYTISGFRAGSYGAEFLVFNATDTALSLDETSGNYLRIQGVTFTQGSSNELTVDNYFSKNSDFSNPQLSGSSLVKSPLRADQDYKDIKTSRMTYGKNEFTLDTPYIQSEDSANAMMEWLVGKIMKPRKSVGLKIFATPTIQLGDIVNISYVNNDGLDQVSPVETRFVVYNIQYERNSEGPQMTVFLSEVA